MTVKKSNLIRFFLDIWAAMAVYFFGAFAAWDIDPGEWSAAWRVVVAISAFGFVLSGLPK